MSCVIVVTIKKVVVILLHGNTVHDQIKSLIYAQGLTIKKVVDEMNKSRPPDQRTTVQNISNKLMRGTIKFSEVFEIAKILGGTLSWEPLATGDGDKA